MNKAAIRKEMRARLQMLSTQQIREASESITRQVLASEEFLQAHTVMAYISMPMEPETGELILQAGALGKQVLLPRCKEPPCMEALPWRGNEWLQPGPFGIPEPVREEGMLAIPEPDLILVPCLAATKKGARLGHGAGYYDWYLRRHSGKKICLCFQIQLLETIPVTSTDVMMDQVFWA